MFVKIVIVLILGFIIFNLFRALFIMVSGNASNKPMSYFLGKRVLYSAIALIVIIGSAKLGLIKFNPNPLVKEHTQTQTNTTTPHPQNANTKPPLGRQNAADQ
jgi:hypothetical protein